MIEISKLSNNKKETEKLKFRLNSLRKDSYDQNLDDLLINNSENITLLSAKLKKAKLNEELNQLKKNKNTKIIPK